jgi:hypothetical protein
MTRMVAAGLLAQPVLLAAGAPADAQNPGCSPGGYSAPAQGSCSVFGCGGFCFKLFPHLHQYGPLVNYGPYYWYYPFEPYGPWNAQLQYTGPRPGDSCGWLHGRCNGCGHHGWGWGRNGQIDGCASCGHRHYAAGVWANVKGRVFPASHKAGKLGCSSCGQ